MTISSSNAPRPRHTYLTYRDSKTVIESLTKAKVSRHRVHGYVQKVGRYVENERVKTVKEKVDLMYGDGTKAHSHNGKKNEINVVLGKDAEETDEKRLLALSVNKDWKETAKRVKGKADVLIADADRAMRTALLGKAMNYQLCVSKPRRQRGEHPPMEGTTTKAGEKANQLTDGTQISVSKCAELTTWDCIPLPWKEKVAKQRIRALSPSGYIRLACFDL